MKTKTKMINCEHCSRPISQKGMAAHFAKRHSNNGAPKVNEVTVTFDAQTVSKILTKYILEKVK